MKWSAMNQRDRRALLLGALVLLPFVLFIWVVRPYMAALSDARDRLETERATLARERAAIAVARQSPRLQHVADSVMRSTQQRVFAGKDDAMASSELAAYLGDVAERSRVLLQSAGTRPAAPVVDGVRTLHVEIRAESDLLGTLLFLQNLERGEKLVRVDRLDISRVPRAGEDDSETLSIAATISGFAIDDGSSAAAAASPAPAKPALVSPTASLDAAGIR
jgi:hypothetical protein